MRNLTFELYKIKREIYINGKRYNIYRENKDDYGTITGEYTLVEDDVKGLFHTSKSYISSETSDGTKTHTKGQPMLLMCYENTERIQQGDIIFIGDNKYKIVEKNNIQMCDIVCDISMELVVNDKN